MSEGSSVDTGGRAEVEAAIPHRAPFLFVDRVAERGEGSILTEWRVPEDADWFRGHYPGEPVTPGVLISEHAFQSGALMISGELGGFRPEDGVPVLAKIEGARFRRIVRPGETLLTTVRTREKVGPAWFLTGKVTCEGERVLEIDFVLSAAGAMGRSAEGA